MIRFVDMRAADIAGSRFAFWNTVTGRFVYNNDEAAWDTWADFEEANRASLEDGRDPDPLERFKGLCPSWVFEPPPAEGVCFRCNTAGHEPEECPRDAATVVQAVALALRQNAAHREAHGDFTEPRALRNFADSIDPNSEGYDPNHDPLRQVATERIGPFTRETPGETSERRRKHDQALEAGTSEQRQRAQRRFDELHPEANAEFGGRPLMERGRVALNAYSHKTVEVWYRARGVEVTVIGAFLDGLLTEVIGLAPHACQECGHVNGGHRDGCQGSGLVPSPRPVFEEQPDGHTRVRVR
jgi:hypothetical protein